MQRLLNILSIIGLFFMLSCTEETNNNNDVFWGSEYFPLETGHTLTYMITEINIDKPSDVYDTTIYFIKEIIDIPVLDNEEDTAYRIERYSRFNTEDNWVIHSVWTAKRTENTAEKVEENFRFVKIRFPVKNNYTWNGNIYNELEEKEYWISDFHAPYSTENFMFDSCLIVYQDSSQSLIHKDLAVEVYAIHTGLVYKEETYINSQEVIFEIPIEDRITTGTIFKQELIEIQ